MRIVLGKIHARSNVAWERTELLPWILSRIKASRRALRNASWEAMKFSEKERDNPKSTSPLQEPTHTTYYICPTKREDESLYAKS